MKITLPSKGTTLKNIRNRTIKQLKLLKQSTDNVRKIEIKESTKSYLIIEVTYKEKGA